MDDPDYEVHPLDRDYSEAEPESNPMLKMPEGKVHRAGIIIFLIGFVALIVTAGLLGIFRGSGPLETFGSYVHRFAMVMILSGGILILVGLRIRSLELFNRPKGLVSGHGIPTLGILLVVNIIAFIALYTTMNLIFANASMKGFSALISGAFTVFAGLMGVVAVHHRGAVRGFAIGVLAALILASSGLSDLNFYYYSSRSSRIMSYWTQRLLTIQISGMVCAGYAVLADRKRLKRDESAGS